MESSTVESSEQKTMTEQPWQLQMFSKSLKKQQKLAALLKVMGDFEGQKGLLITCGDNNGAMNWHIKHHGGEWHWADAEFAGKNGVTLTCEAVPEPRQVRFAWAKVRTWANLFNEAGLPALAFTTEPVE